VGFWICRPDLRPSNIWIAKVPNLTPVRSIERMNALLDRAKAPTRHFFAKVLVTPWSCPGAPAEAR
jgi:hypothetical protein